MVAPSVQRGGVAGVKGYMAYFTSARGTEAGMERKVDVEVRALYCGID